VTLQETEHKSKVVFNFYGMFYVMKEQILIQDTLKFFAECEYEEQRISRESIAAELSIVQDEVDRLLGDLKSAKLIEPDYLKLTPVGREYALHVLRAHRLYETYLANKTGVSESQWHVQADIEEHKLSAADVHRLDRELGYPLYDPHGDPIPTAAGEIPPKRGQALTDFNVGWQGRVVHVEDEPPHLYAELVAANIALGTVVRIVSKSERNVNVSCEGCDLSFPSLLAQNITVESLAEGESFDESLVRLSSLTEDEQATIVRLSPLIMGLERNRLLDLGFVPGTVVTVDLISPSGSPIAYRVRKASIALRREQTERILIRKIKD
jgi:DtxR family Mn-dependent transcriptional regulator